MLRTLILVLTFTSFVPAGVRAGTNEPKEYKSKNRERVVISPIRKWTAEPSYQSYESKIEFYSADNQKLCTLDYSSEDHEHGFAVVKAAWTPDNNYFVFSLTSSGGHQAWHAPTLFYSVRDNKIRSLDDYVEAAGISKGDFALRSPNTVLTEVWRGVSIPTKFRLDSLINGGHKSPRSLSCTGGNVLQPED